MPSPSGCIASSWSSAIPSKNPEEAAPASECARVQLALVHGEDDAAAAAHLERCFECRFFGDLSRQARRAARGELAPSSTALGAPFQWLLEELLQQGARLGKYRLVELRGWGGQGYVFKAQELETGDTVALKILRASGERAGVDELLNARRISHPNVSRVYHTERHGDVRLIVMELIDGPSLADAAPALAAADRLPVFEKVVLGVRAAHQAGVLHLDLKPSNILMRGPKEPVVTDFGLSSSLHAADDLEAGARGWTWHYASPEQLAGERVDRRADVYSLGQLLRDLTREGPRWAAAVVARATARRMEDRYRDVDSLLAAIGGPRRRARRLRRTALPAALAGALAVAFALLPAPRGPRAPWHADLWGTETIPESAWNVALNPDASGLPALAVSHPFFACGRYPWELLDGKAEYVDWEHGVAFAPPLGLGTERHFCVRLRMAGRCGRIEPDAHLCRYAALESPLFEALPLTGRDVPSLPRPFDPHIGQLVPNLPCGERSFTVTLDRPRPVLGVRAWSHDMQLPRYVRVDVLGVRGETSASFPAQRRGEETRLKPARNLPGSSIPITVEFSPTVAKQVRFTIDTCSTLDDDELALYRRRAELPGHGTLKYPAHGWLYELEVFARVTKGEALWRWLKLRL